MAFLIDKWKILGAIIIIQDLFSANSLHISLQYYNI